MSTFLAIVEQRSLTRAARVLQTSLPTVVRTLAALEHALGVRLVNRTTRRSSITEEGREYAEHCRRLLASIDEAERLLVDRKAVPRGRVVLTAPVPFGRARVAPAIHEFLRAHPAVSVELLLLDRITNLTEEGIDLAVRLGKLADSSLIAVPVGHTRRVVCASPAYLAEHGRPKRPQDLTRHRCLRFIDGGSWKSWELRSGPKAVRVPVDGPFDTNLRDAQIAASVRGLGCVQVLEYQVSEQLRSGALERLLESHEPPAVPIHVVYPHARLLSARVRVVIDSLVTSLRAFASTAP